MQIQNKNQFKIFHIFKNSIKHPKWESLIHTKIYSIYKIFTLGKNHQKLVQNDQIWPMVVLWICFTRQTPIKTTISVLYPAIFWGCRFSLSVARKKTVHSWGVRVSCESSLVGSPPEHFGYFAFWIGQNIAWMVICLFYIN